MDKRNVRIWLLEHMPSTLYVRLVSGVKGVTIPRNTNKKSSYAVTNMQLLQPKNIGKLDLFFSKVSESISKNGKESESENLQWNKIVKSYVLGDYDKATSLIETFSERVSKEVPQKLADIRPNSLESKSLNNSIIKKLKQQIENRDNNIKELKAEIKSKDSKISDLKKVCQDLRSANLRFEGEVENKKKQLSATVNRMKTEKEYSIKLIQETKTMKKEIKDRNDTISHLNEKNLEQSGKLADLLSKAESIERSESPKDSSNMSISDLDQKTVLQIGFPNKIKNKQIIAKLNVSEVFATNRVTQTRVYNFRFQIFEEISDLEKQVSQVQDSIKYINIYSGALNNNEKYRIEKMAKGLNLKAYLQNSIEEFETSWL
ncbi:hypothetical protein ACFP1L_00605 [Lactiplantibacillus nangangensis]|uniref:Uncharacterized protein n=1 Tax=Lactiplantibacillus nangangensis TaxID=2559917 RepID=A0ABW1SGN9_9LACO|nr:hypothetical protein [Lactiplantibacillus nangangensis]